MICLAIRTDNPKAELALYKDGQCMQAIHWQAHRQLAETIHQQLDNLMQQAGYQLSDLDGLVVYKGPGSFTGLRIGLSVANALAYSLSKPIVGTTGEDWQNAGLDLLKRKHGQRSVLPEYGAPVHITEPKH